MYVRFFSQICKVFCLFSLNKLFPLSLSLSFHDSNDMFLDRFDSVPKAHYPISTFFKILFSPFTWWFHMTDTQVFWVCLLPDHTCFWIPLIFQLYFSALLFLLGCFWIVSFSLLIFSLCSCITFLISFSCLYSHLGHWASLWSLF